MAVLESVPRRPPATGDELTLAAADVDVARDLVDRARVDERADVGRLVEPGAESHAARAPLEALEQRLHDAPLDDHPRARGAALAGRPERRPEDPVGGQVEVRVGEHDDTVLAAELEAEALEAPARLLREHLPGRGAPRERDDGDVGALDDRIADLGAAPRHEVDDAGRETGLGHQLDDERRAMRACRWTA